MNSREPRRPDLFIIGAAKCGTTSLYQYLKGHPEIYMSARKEPRYFAPDLISGPKRKRLNYKKDLDRYLALFDGARDELRLGEASPNYIYSREAPTLVREFDPRAYIVVTLRDPVDMMHSLHAHHVAGGTETITDFAAALAAREERSRGVGVRAEGNPLSTLYLDRGRFGEQLARWYDAFDRERIHVMILEDMTRDPAQSYERLLSFLDVDPSYRPALFEVHNPRWRARISLVQKVASSRVGQRLRWDVLPELMGEERVRHLTGPLKKVYRTGATRPPLDPALRRRLQNELADDVALLSQLLGRDMAALWWGKRDDAAKDPARVPTAGGAASP